MVSKTYRLKNEIIKICDYLQFKYRRSEHYVFEYVFQYSLEYIGLHGVHFDIEKYPGRREVRGVTISKESVRLLDKFRNNYKLQAGEFVEILIYIFAINHLSKEEQKILGLKNLGIKKGR